MRWRTLTARRPRADAVPCLRQDRDVSSAREDDLRSIFTSKAAQVLPPVAQDLIDTLEIDEDDRARVDAVGQALARAYMEGTAVGATEMFAQAAERGIPLSLTWLGQPAAQ